MKFILPILSWNLYLYFKNNLTKIIRLANVTKIDNYYYLYYTEILFFRHGNQDAPTRTDLQEIRSKYVRRFSRLGGLFKSDIIFIK